MKRKTMSESGYHMTVDDINNFVFDILDDISSFCKNKYSIFADESVDDGRTLFGDIVYVSIGIKSLDANMLPSGHVRDEDAIWVLYQAFHEKAHVWQNCIAYMQEDASDDIKDMARMRVVRSCFPEYRNYIQDLNELYADSYALSHIISFMKEKAASDSRFSDIDLNSIVCEKEKTRKGIEIRSLHKCSTVQDIILCYDDYARQILSRKFFDIYRMTGTNGISSHTKRLFKDKKICNSILDADNGHAELEILCECIGKWYPGYFKDLPCIRDDYCKGAAGQIVKVAGKVVGFTKSHDWVNLDLRQNPETDIAATNVCEEYEPDSQQSCDAVVHKKDYGATVDVDLGFELSIEQDDMQMT